VRQKPKITLVGSGSFATVLAPALRDAGYLISKIISRNASRSRQRARILATKVGAEVATIGVANLDADLLWFCVPDREIWRVATLLAGKSKSIRFAFHSSGALRSGALESLRKNGTAIVSVHPLMTFVPGSRPSLSGVPFALEGEAGAVRLARRIVRDLNGESFALPASRKAAYHTWATLSSPLFLSFLVTLEEAAELAGLSRVAARQKSLPIIRQTLENYSRLGPKHSFSGPIIRGDVETVAKHLSVLRKIPDVRDVYVALVRSALCRLPANNQKELWRLLESQG